MGTRSLPKLVLLTGMRSGLAADLVPRLKTLPCVEFEDVVFWSQRRSLVRRLRRNFCKSGPAYAAAAVFALAHRALVAAPTRLFERFSLEAHRADDLAAACGRGPVKLHRVSDIHAPEGVRLLRSLGCDILAVCGTGILRRPVLDVPTIGTVNLHQGKAPEYRGAPPGFWELWNGEDAAGVTIHYVDEGVDTGDIILQRTVPIFAYDTLASVQHKLDETALGLYPEAIRQVAEGAAVRVCQDPARGRQYFLPTVWQQARFRARMLTRSRYVKTVARNAAKRCLIAALLPLLLLRDRWTLRTGTGVLTVLYYHRVTDLCRDGMTIDRAEFERQLRLLKRWYRVLGSGDLEAALDGRADRSGRQPVLLTFDDGYADNEANALPLLRRYDCPAMFFVSTAIVGTAGRFDHDRFLQPRLRFGTMTWEQLREARAHGITVGVHGDTHANLGRVALQAAQREIDASVAEYVRQFGEEPLAMSFPFGQQGDITPEVVRHVRERTPIRYLFSAYGGRNVGPVDRYDIRRINVGSNDRGLVFWFKIVGGLSRFRRARPVPTMASCAR